MTEQGDTQGMPATTDAGSGPSGTVPPERALGDALRLSLRVLKLLLVVAVVFFFGNGIFLVPEGSRGLVTIGGTFVRDDENEVTVYGPGLHFTLPPPLGTVLMIQTQAVKQVETTGFWYHVEADDALRALQRPDREKPLVPGRDGSLICGDGSLMHARLRAEYRVGDPVTYYRAFRLDEEREREVLGRLLERSTVRNALTVRWLASDTAAIGLDGFIRKITEDLGAAFADHGLTLTQVSPVELQVPRQVQDAFARNQRAAAAVARLREELKAGRFADARTAALRSQREAILTKAIITAGTILQRAREDLARARELAPLVKADPSLFKRLVLQAWREVLSNAKIHPVLTGDGTSEYRVRLRSASDRAAGVEEEKEEEKQ